MTHYEFEERRDAVNLMLSREQEILRSADSYTTERREVYRTDAAARCTEYTAKIAELELEYYGTVKY